MFIELCEPREEAASHDIRPGQFTVFPLLQCVLSRPGKVFFYLFLHLLKGVAGT